MGTIFLGSAEKRLTRTGPGGGSSREIARIVTDQKGGEPMSRMPRSAKRLFVFFLSCAAAVSLASAQWVEFVDETGTRLSAAASVGTGDVEEKDYAWGDVDNDGDIDLVVVRKEPVTTPGKRTNVLFLNENGVLTDRTSDFADTSDVPGDNGFLTATNDRDVQLADLNDDGWLDIVTAVTISDGDSKQLGHPRIYVNLGEDAGNNWLGFRHEDARIPTMLSYSGGSNFNPRFCSVAVGDLTGDGVPELWFGDYDSSGAGGFDQPAGSDFNDRLLINDGNGFFTDDTQGRFSGVISIPNSTNTRFEVSAFGAAANIADMNGDGVEDVIKQTSLQSPLYVGIAYNDLSNEGFFDEYEVVNNQSPYFVSVGDLNQDGKLDLVITDDGADRYLLNQGNGADGKADFVSFSFSYDAASDDGFGSNSIIDDLNNDGWNDVLIADVDVDDDGCTRRMHMFRNLGGAPGGNVTLQEQTSGSGCATSAGNPASCIVASIPSNMLEGVHDVAIFDLNGDGWKDMVLGRCASTEIYINQPPIGLTFSYPQGLPFFVDPNQPYVFQAQLNGFGGATPEPGTVKMFASVTGGPFTEVTLTDLGSDLFEATLPAAPNCTDTIEFYFTADASGGGGTFNDPAGAPTETYTALAAFGTEVILEEGFEGDTSAWTVVNDPSLTAGGWEVAEPNGTLTGGGEQAAPDEDAEAPLDATFAFVTENGSVGGTSGAADVDGGPTDLISPAIDLAGTDATISYSAWFFTSGDDSMTVWVSGDGSSWNLVETITGTAGEWQVNSFRVGEFLTPPTATTQVRFRVQDNPNNNITEGGIDLFTVDKLSCSQCTIPADCDDSVFCNGAEQCTAGLCVPGGEACPGQFCDEVGDTCADCFVDGQCDDGDFCNGTETCTGNACVPGSDPCSGGLCDDTLDVCVDCLGDGDCDDGVFCNGIETCNAGFCTNPAESCPGQVCDEVGDVCIGTVALQPQLGDPLLGLTGDQLARFNAGKIDFEAPLTEAGGLGPVFNQSSCGACHNVPVGGSGSITVTRFGFNDDKGGGFDGLSHLGGSLRQAEAIRPECAEVVPVEANVTALRLTNSILGFGLVESVPDADIQFNETNPPAGVSGVAHMVPALEAPGPLRVGRFGWKAQVPTLLTFSADASLNEMGLTNRFLTTENDPNGVNAPTLGAPDNCDTVPDPEDGPDGQGLHFIDRVTDFQRFLAAPPQTPRSGMTGETLFNNVGCANCHASSFTTADDAGLPGALRNKALRPYSDFLLHDMGGNADFIEQGGAAARELRTAPLWGLRVRDPLWHDGRVAGGTFESRVTAAIGLHDSLGSEGTSSALSFNALSTTDKADLVSFLNSLGRNEFDLDGDGDVDGSDFQALLACKGGGPYTADDNCAVADVDQDGDVDNDDQALFAAVAEGQAGRVPDGDVVPGTQLRVEHAGGGDIVLTWGDSCLNEDSDYEIYEGVFGGDFTSHAALFCSTGGLTNRTFTPLSGSAYYLIVPTNGFREGGYGFGNGGPRIQGAGACLPQEVADTCSP